MNSSNLIDDIKKAIINRPPTWRKGQAAFNRLHEVGPRWAEHIRGSGLDPFYLDERLPGFFDWVLRWCHEDIMDPRLVSDLKDSVDQIPTRPDCVDLFKTGVRPDTAALWRAAKAYGRVAGGVHVSAMDAALRAAEGE